VYSRAEARRVIKSGVLVVGIDVAKRRHVATIRLPDGSRRKSFGFSNDRPGFDSLLARAESARSDSGSRTTLFAIESSGHYGHALKHFLTWGGYSVVGINPAHTKKAKEIEDNSPEKNDSKDSRIIADLAAQGRGKPMMIPRGAYADLRHLGKLRERLSVERTRILNRYKGLIDLTFPELDNVVRDVACKSIRRLMAQYPSALEVSQLGREELHGQLRRWSFGRVCQEQCYRIDQAARRSVGVTEGLDAARLEMRQTLRALDLIEDRIKEVEAAQEASSVADSLCRVPVEHTTGGAGHSGDDPGGNR
jgi:transposase